ncbi:uncharacterized protein LAESUDRAFT_541747 [Laetiporus sulphureus 93-53]|uniref:DUF6699 domain-containing protein n=1 Tax=Laetiporus sulphureus 93-53 TaxID=1314785 RepID=A0A165FM05_9APHY|nr:uncharacterized protein LAESUDRAFT_541747 [Laetiporus sulphureus 93-53]KZT09173.1 hypothetical protein LAESUDRAFT_541747 [Laetiporus sulphureus 93-53]
MFMRLLKGADSIPPAPKLGRLELPDIGEGDVYHISPLQMSAVLQDSSSDDEGSTSPLLPVAPSHRPSSPQTEILKPRRKIRSPRPDSPLYPTRRTVSTTQPDSSDWKAGSAPSTPEDKLSSSRPLTPQPGAPEARSDTSTPAKPLKGILKPAPPLQPVTLHWQLLPFDPAWSKKKIYFDVARPVHFIRDHTHMPPVALTDFDLLKPASEVPLTKMDIRCSQLPHWDIFVKPSIPGGIRCIDVYDAIYQTFHCKLTTIEKDYYIPSERRTRCEAQFRRRCRESPALEAVELRDGMRRVDLLEGRTIFMGLRRPVDTDDKPDSYWVLDLGLPNDSRK